MTDGPATALTGAADVPPAGLEPDAIGPVQDTVIGMANAAPAVSVGLTLAALAAAAAYAVGPIIILTALPMLIIANAYRRLNLWKAECGASFEWVGRAVNPYLGFLTGWLMITGTLVGVVSGVVVLAPSVLAVFGSTSTSTWPDILISTAIILIMIVIAIAGAAAVVRARGCRRRYRGDVRGAFCPAFTVLRRPAGERWPGALTSGAGGCLPLRLVWGHNLH